MKVKVHFVTGESKVFTRHDFSTFEEYMKQIKEREQKPWLFFKEALVRTEHVVYIEEAKGLKCYTCVNYDSYDCYYCEDESKYKEEAKEHRSCSTCGHYQENKCNHPAICYMYTYWKPKEAKEDTKVISDNGCYGCAYGTEFGYCFCPVVCTGNSQWKPKEESNE